MGVGLLYTSAWWYKTMTQLGQNLTAAIAATFGAAIAAIAVIAMPILAFVAYLFITLSIFNVSNNAFIKFIFGILALPGLLILLIIQGVLWLFGVRITSFSDFFSFLPGIPILSAEPSGFFLIVSFAVGLVICTLYWKPRVP